MKVTETEYETVETEVTRYRCDHCQTVVDEDDINTVEFFDGTGHSSVADDAHYCEDCIGLREALDRRKRVDTLRERWSAFAGAISLSIPFLAVAVAYTLGASAVWVAGSAETSAGNAVVVAEMFGSTVVAALGLGMISVVAHAALRLLYPA